MLRFALIIGLSTCLVFGIPSPVEIEDDYEYDQGETLCLTSKDSKDPEKECVFPFTHVEEDGNFTYHGCPTDPQDKTRRWCSTKTDENGVHINGIDAWGYCTPGCNPEIFEDELLIATEAEKDIQTKTCDYTACNAFTYKLNLFDTIVTYGQCQYPAGVDGANEDFFCFVNSDSACEDMVPYGEENLGLFLSTLACEDPNAPLPRYTSNGWETKQSSSTGLMGYAIQQGRYRRRNSHSSRRNSYNSNRRSSNRGYGRGRRQCRWQNTRRGRVWRCNNRG